jgi:hypothetical protein
MTKSATDGLRPPASTAGRPRRHASAFRREPTEMTLWSLQQASLMTVIGKRVAVAGVLLRFLR